MRKLLYRLITFFLILAILSGLGGALAVPADYPDIKGHWAENTFIRALGDALIVETGGSLKPDDPMTGAEILAILCKILSAKKEADISGVTDIGKEDANYTVAAQAVALGLISPVNGKLNLSKPVTRGWAFVMLAEVFQLNAAEPDTSSLSKFSDGNTISGAFRHAAASLVSNGFVQGINGSLNINDNISRAEFLTVLYKMLPSYMKGQTNPVAESDGTILSGMTLVSNTQFTGNVYFDCTSSIIQLQNVVAPAVVVRSDNLTALSVLSCEIDRFILAQGGGNVNLSPRIASGISTLVIGAGGGNVTLGYGLSNVEVTGTGRDVTITGPVKKLLISGSGNNITFAPGASAESVKITGSGVGNTVTVNGAIGECAVFGPETVIPGTGTIQRLEDNAKNSAITVNAIDTYTDKDYGLNSVELDLTAPDNVSSYETLKASVSIKAPDGSRICRGSWYIDGVYISQSDVDIGAVSAVSFKSDIKNSGDSPVTSTLSFVLTFSDADGNYQEIRAEKNVTLLNKPVVDADKALALVTTSYKGDYTLAWAKSHDYDDGVKTAWVNAKEYSSKTSYLVWVTISAPMFLPDRPENGFLTGRSLSGQARRAGIRRQVFLK
jgi:hypothetical protein